MDCGGYLDLLSARLDGELTEAQERELEAHLAACPECRAAGAQLAALRPAFDELEDVPAPEGLAQSVMDRVRAGEAPKVISPFRRFRALTGLAACLALAVGLYCARPGETGDMDRMTRDFVPDEQTEYGNAGLPGEAPQIDARSVPEDGDAVVCDVTAPSFAAVITFERLPEGWEELFPGMASPDAMQVSAGEARAFLRLLEEQGIISEITGSLDENGLCQLLLSEA